MQAPVTVALIDDDEAILDSLRMILSSRGLHTECYTSAEQFLARLDTAPPSCAVSDVLMPGLSGLDLQREMTRRGSAVPLILMTGHGDIAMAVGAIKAGAYDFVEKPFDNEVLIDTIRKAVDSGERARSANARTAEVLARLAELSQRQRQVLDLVVQGLSNKQIAARLGVSPRTVENYRAWVMEKMGAANLADLVRMIVQVESRTGHAGERQADGD